jgi:hypothetical protein
MSTQTDRAANTIGTAPKFDPYDRVYVLVVADSVTSVVTDHPVMHRAAHLLGIRLGSLASTPNDGFDVDAIKESTRITAQRTAEDTVKRALKILTDAGDLEIIKVVAVTKPRWLGQIFTDLRNLRELNAKPVRFQTAS